MHVELLPRALIVGMLTPSAPPGVTVTGMTLPEVDFDAMTRVFNELAPAHGYRNFQSAPDGKSGQISGSQVDEFFMMQPGLLQFQDPATFGAQVSATKAQDVFRVAMKHFRVTQFLQLGVKWVFHAPTETNDARGFVLHNMLGKGDADLATLSLGASLWAGLKFVTAAIDGQATYTVNVEPLVADMASLFIAIDAQFLPTPAGDGIVQKIMDVHDYAQRPLRQYLESI